MWKKIGRWVHRKLGNVHGFTDACNDKHRTNESREKSADALFEILGKDELWKRIGYGWDRFSGIRGSGRSFVFKVLLKNATTEKEQWRIYNATWNKNENEMRGIVLATIIDNLTTQEERWELYNTPRVVSEIEQAALIALSENATTQTEREEVYNKMEDSEAKQVIAKKMEQQAEIDFKIATTQEERRAVINQSPLDSKVKEFMLMSYFLNATTQEERQTVMMQSSKNSKLYEVALTSYFENATAQNERWDVYDRSSEGSKLKKAALISIEQQAEIDLKNATTQEERWEVLCHSPSASKVKKAALASYFKNATTQEERWQVLCLSPSASKVKEKRLTVYFKNATTENELKRVYANSLIKNEKKAALAAFVGMDMYPGLRNFKQWNDDAAPCSREEIELTGYVAIAKNPTLTQEERWEMYNYKWATSEMRDAALKIIAEKATTQGERKEVYHKAVDGSRAQEISLTAYLKHANVKNVAVELLHAED